MPPNPKHDYPEINHLTGLYWEELDYTKTWKRVPEVCSVSCSLWIRNCQSYAVCVLGWKGPRMCASVPGISGVTPPVLDRDLPPTWQSYQQIRRNSSSVYIGCRGCLFIPRLGNVQLSKKLGCLRNTVKKQWHIIATYSIVTHCKLIWTLFLKTAMFAVYM